MLVLHAGSISGDDLKSHSEEEVFNWLQNGGRARMLRPCRMAP
jgi:hypothetical protein